MRTLLSLLFLASAVWAQTPPAGYLQAVKLHQAGRLEAAAEAYQAYLQEDPGRPEALSNLGAVQAALGRYDEAIESYDQALAAIPGHEGVLRNRALALYKSGRLTEAAEAFAELRTKQPDDLTLALLQADSRFRLGDEPGVIEILEPLAAAHADNPALAYLLGTALIREDRVDEGRALVEKILAQGDQAEAHLLMGLAHVQGGAMHEAKQEFEQAIRLNPDVPAAHSHLGKTLLELGERDAAAEAFQQELRRNPTDYDANLFLGVYLREEGRPADALPYLERTVRLRPQAFEAQYQVALAHIGAEDYPSAQTTLEAILAKAPGFPEAHVSLATVYARLGRKDDARRHQELARELAR